MKNLLTSKYRFLAGLPVLKVGEAYESAKYADYECESKSFASALYKAAKFRGLSVSVAVFPDCVVYTFWRTNSVTRPNLKRYPVVMKMRGEE